MSTFLATQGMRVQRHFEVFEIDLPVITGTCTIGSAQGFGTPLTCDQPWANQYKTYYFTNNNAPILPSINGEPIWRCITAIKENTPEIKPGSGLASRGSLSITFKDFTDQDPNIGAPGVTANVKKQGTFFGKLSKRQIFENKDVRLKLYRVQADGSVDLANGAQTRNYIAKDFKLNAKSGNWSLDCKDLISVANLNDKSWPINTGGVLRLDVDRFTNTIPVDVDTNYSSAVFIRVGDELLKVVSFDNTNPAAPFLNVATRGGDLLAPTSGVLLSETNASNHSAGDEIFICDLSDNETIDSLLTRVLVDSDVDISIIPAADWAAEVAEWHSTDKINTLHTESGSVNSVLNRILTGYLMDLGFLAQSNSILLSAISVWKESTATLAEGKEVNAYSISKTPNETLRASRALVVYDKRNLTNSDDTPSYKKGSQFADSALISPALFSKHKDKQFDNNFLIDKGAAELLTQRYVSRFKFTPYTRKFQTEERALTFKLGDVVDLVTTVDLGPDGLQSGNIRAQVTKVNPRYNKDGRIYDITTMSYEAAFDAGSEIVLDEPLDSVNLHILAGAPSQPLTLTFVLDGSYAQGDTAIRAGNFPAGSKIIIILVNGFDGQATGGDGAEGQSISKFIGFPLNVISAAQAGGDGGIVYDAQGIDTDIYFSGATPSTAYPTADGYIRAPSGGDGGFNHTTSGSLFISGNGGNAGDGRQPGVGGEFGPAFGNEASQGSTGTNGQIDGTGSGWGNVGASNDATGGLAGSGIIDGLNSLGLPPTVTLFGATSARYINGNGDH